MQGVISEKEINDFLNMKTVELDPVKIDMTVCPDVSSYESVLNHVEYILGNPWRIMVLQDPKITEWKGRCSCTGSRIIQFNLQTIYSAKVGDVFVDLERVIRHEIIHAYIFEAGLEDYGGETPNWSTNEMTVDWFAYQIPKIMESAANISKVITPIFNKLYYGKSKNVKKPVRNKELQKQYEQGLITKDVYEARLEKLENSAAS